MSFILVGLIKTAWKIYSVLFAKVKAIILILHQFNLYGHFKKMLYLNYFQHSPGANCINDFDQILSSVMLSTDKALILEEPNQELFIFKGIPVGTVDYRHLEIPERNSFTYGCG